MNCDNCRWFNKNGFAPGFGDCVVHREVYSSNYVCTNYAEYEPRPHGEWTTESAIDYLTEIGWLPAHDRILTERPHGEWEHWGSPFSDDSIANSIVCSLCKARYVEIEDEVFNFCPNCGADMREGEAE